MKTRKGKTGNVLKIVELGLQDKVYEAMKQSGFSAEGLARELTSDGTKITAQSIRKFIKKTKKAQQEIIRTDIKAASEITKTIMDYNVALKDILNEVEEVKNMAREEKDLTTYNQLIGRIFQGIELIAKLTGDIKPKGNTDIKIIYNEINNVIEQEMKPQINDIFKDSEIIDVEHEILEEDKEMARRLKNGEI